MRASYWLLVGRTSDGRRTLGRLNGVEGEALIPVYTTAEAAEAHALLMRPGYDVIEGGPADLAEFIAVFAPDDDFVALDPPLAEEGGGPQPVRGIPVEKFLERLREEAREE